MCGGKILKPCFGLSGYSAEEAIGQPLTLIIPSQLHQRHDTGMERMNQRKKPRVIGKVLELKAKKARKIPHCAYSWKPGQRWQKIL